MNMGTMKYMVRCCIQKLVTSKVVFLAFVTGNTKAINAPLTKWLWILWKNLVLKLIFKNKFVFATGKTSVIKPQCMFNFARHNLILFFFHKKKVTAFKWSSPIMKFRTFYEIL